MPLDELSEFERLERMKALCNERNELYEKQNDLKGQKQQIERGFE